jgi:[ribosomal protein S18]-alanine N-acetyltransferase
MSSREGGRAPAHVRAEASIRLCAAADLLAILAIEQSSFTAPWTQAAFLQELCNANSRVLVAEQNGEVTGYLCCWRVVDELHILKVAVLSEYRRHGVGRILLEHALAQARQSGACQAHLEVRQSNLAALTLYKNLGFHVVGERRGYYENKEDALVLICDLTINSANAPCG